MTTLLAEFYTVSICSCCNSGACRLDEDDYGGFSPLLSEGMGPGISVFLVSDSLQLTICSNTSAVKNASSHLNSLSCSICIINKWIGACSSLGYRYTALLISDFLKKVLHNA